MAHLITQWVDSGGIVAIFLLMLIESCGIPAPSEVTMPLAGYFAATGHLSFAAAVLAGAIGNLVGSGLAYALAARWGAPLLLGPGRRVGLSPHHLELADHWFRRWGLAAVFFGRLLPVIRTYISFPAGLARVRVVPFAVLTFAGALPWSAALAWGGYVLGADYERLSGPIEKVAVLLALAVTAVIVWWFLRGRRADA